MPSPGSDLLLQALTQHTHIEELRGAGAKRWSAKQRRWCHGTGAQPAPGTCWGQEQGWGLMARPQHPNPPRKPSEPSGSQAQGGVAKLRAGAAWNVVTIQPK